MGHLDSCLVDLRTLIAAGDANGVPRAEKAIHDYWEATPPPARKSGLLYLQEVVRSYRDAATGGNREVAETIIAYIEKKLGE